MGKGIVAGAFGYIIELAAERAMAGYTDAKLHIEDVHGDWHERPLVVTNPSDGTMEYTVQDGDFPVKGTYLAQVVIQFGPGKNLKSRVFNIVVGRQLQPAG